MDDTHADTLRLIELVAQAEDVARTDTGTISLAPETQAALLAAHQAVLDHDLGQALEAVKQPVPGQVLAAHQRLRQIVTVAFVIGTVTNPTFLSAISSRFLDDHGGGRPLLN